MEEPGVRNPVVSVVIPCYRQARFLPAAIESVLGQSHPRVDIIVVDDGSPDDTVGVAARYAGVRCVRQRNLGLPAARNTGLRESTGDFVVFLDADDRLTPDALASGLREMAVHPECAFVAGEHALIDDAGAAVESARRQMVGGDYYRELLKTNFIWCPATVMYRRSVFGAVGGFDTSLRSAEDYDLYLRIARRFPVRTHGHVVAEYRLHGAAMSQNSSRMLRFTVKVLRAHRKQLHREPALEAACDGGIEAYQQLYGIPLIRQIASHIRVRQWRRAVPESLVALWYYPSAFASHACQRLYRTVVEALT